MRRCYLMDTGIASDYINDRKTVRKRALQERKSGHCIGICIPVLGELWTGIECSQSRERNLARLVQGTREIFHWPYSFEAAAEYGRIFAELKRVGRTIQQIDIQIAAIARTMPHCIAVSKDTDTSAVAGVTVENWAV